MKTEDLVAMLARGPVAADPRAVERTLAVAAGAGALMAVVLMWGVLGVRPDIAAVVAAPAFWWKLAFPLSLAVVGFAVVARLARPGAGVGGGGPAIALPLVLVWALAAAQWFATPPQERLGIVLGHSAAVCVASVALLALPTLAAACVALRALAPTRLRAAGAAAGLLAGAVAASAYAVHCDEMQAPFIAVWYVLGMALPTALGALLGPRVLRWA